MDLSFKEIFLPKCKLYGLMAIFANLIICASECFAIQNSFQESLEEIIALDNNLDDVLVTFVRGAKLDENLEIIEVTYETHGKRFKAITRNIYDKEIIILGKYEEALLIPILIDPINIDEPITPENIEFRKYPKTKDLGQVYRSKDSLVGRFAKKRIMPDKPINYKDLGSETLVHRGQTVKMIFQKDNLFIETVGIALDAGGQDEMIRVKNLDSSKVVKAKIKDPETVLVGANSVEKSE